MPDAKRPRSPAWLNIAGSPNANSGSGAKPRYTRPRATNPAAQSSGNAVNGPKASRSTNEGAVVLSENARTVLERRYLAKDSSGRLRETPERLFRRVAHNIALAEAQFAAPGAAEAAVSTAEEAFYDLMTSLRFLPNSPTLGNAGRAIQQLSACFVLPIEDSMEGIFDSLKDTALIHQSGGGTGFAFTRLRPAGDIVASTGGVASGPVSFMRVYDAATESIKQGGTRRGANMAILSVDHPDIEAFINVKSDMTALQNFNISVALTERFMHAVEHDDEYELVNPHTHAVTGTRHARSIFRQIVENAWKNGDPGVVFLDRINRDNPTPQLGRIEATNPCGEQPLLPYESCNLGSLNLSKFVAAAPSTARTNGRSKHAAAPAVDWDALAAAIPVCVRFLDDVIEQNKYPIREIDEMTKKTRKIGLGVMGWADMLFQLGIRYDSEEAIELASRVMSFVQERADAASIALGGERGVFPAWTGSIYDPASGDARSGPRFRNATRTTVAPTGTLSIIADCSGGIEPAFALAFMRQHYLDRKDPSKATRLPEVNGTFRATAEKEGIFTDELLSYLADGGSLQEREEVPAAMRSVFRTSHDIDPEWHVRMQAAFQRHTDNAVSKTINFRHDATVEDVERAYMLAYREGCKGITVYRDGSREHQVLSHATARGPEQAEAVAAEIALGFAELLPLAGGAHPAPQSSTAPRPAGAPYRRHLPDERQSVTHKFRVGEQEGYVTVGLYEEGTPGEIFVNISKEGSTIRGLMDSVAVLTSVALQYGVPLESLAAKFRGVHFEPAGLTNNPQIPTASSLVDYIFRWLELRFLRRESADAPPLPSRPPRRSARSRKTLPLAEVQTPPPVDAISWEQAFPSNPPPEDGAQTSTGMACPDCGAILFFSEGCLTCHSCGYTRC